MTRRLCLAIDLVSDSALIAEYERRHAPGAVWPAIVRELRQRGFEAMEIWRAGERMVMVAEVADDYPLASDPALAADVARWEAEMDAYQRPIAAEGAKWAEMYRIFSLDEQVQPTCAALPRRRLPRSGLTMSELGFGAAALGNLYRPVSDAEAQWTLAAALDAGLTYVDTAPYYGFGLSERRVGDGMRGRPGVTLSTKVGRVLAPDLSVADDSERHGFHSAMPFTPMYDYSYDAILRSWAASRQRLGLARIDILYVHDIGRMTHGTQHDHYFSQLTAGGGFRALEELRAAGEIAAFGLGVNECEVCLEAMAHADLDVLLLAGRYTLLEQGALDQLLPECFARGVGVVIGGAYNSGILATGTRRGGPVHYNYGEAPADVVERVARIEAVCDAHGVSLPAAALRFPLAHPAVVSVIPGLGSAAHVRETLALHAGGIPAAFWSELHTEGLLRADAPVPEVP